MTSFDNIFQQKADSHEAGVPPGVWDKIVRKQRRRRFIFFLLIFCVAFIGTGTFTYLSLKHPKTHDKAISIKNNVAGINKIEGSHNNKSAEKEATENAGNAKEYQDMIPQAGHDNSLNSEAAKTSGMDHRPETSADALAQTDTHQPAVYDLSERNPSISKKRKAIMMTSGASPNSIYHDEGSGQIARKNISVKTKAKSKVYVEQPELIVEETAGDKMASVETEIGKKLSDIDSSINNTKNVSSPTADIIKESRKDSVNSIITAAGNKEPAEKNRKKHCSRLPWFLELNVSPVLSVSHYEKPASFNRTLSLNNTITEFSGKLINTDIDPSVAFSFSFKKALTTRFSAGAGVRYLQLKENINISGVEKKTQYSIIDSLATGVSGPDLLSDTLKTITTGNRSIVATNSYTFISIPVFIQYDFIKHASWRLAGSAGAWLDVYNKYRDEINLNAAALLVPSPKRNANKNGIGIALSGGLLFGKSLTKRIEFSLAPTLAWNILNSNNNLLNKNIHLAMVNVGLSYKLK